LFICWRWFWESFKTGCSLYTPISKKFSHAHKNFIYFILSHVLSLNMKSFFRYHLQGRSYDFLKILNFNVTGNEAENNIVSIDWAVYKINFFKRKFFLWFYSCGDLTCLRGSDELCFNLLERDYKFYLAFENSNCFDYITEKFWNSALM